jgi:hypothetical protein
MENLNNDSASDQSVNRTKSAMAIAHWIIVLFCFVALTYVALVLMHWVMGRRMYL